MIHESRIHQLNRPRAEHARKTLESMHGSIDRSIRYLISRGSGSEDEILGEVAPREAKDGSRALGGKEQQEGNGGSHVYPEGSAARGPYWRCRAAGTRHSAGFACSPVCTRASALVSYAVPCFPHQIMLQCDSCRSQQAVSG
jgi:hypothetical protein